MVATGPAETLSIAIEHTPLAADWAEIVTIYRSSFKADLREPEPLLADRLEAGRYRLFTARKRSQINGFAILDVIPTPSYAVLSYLAVSENHRNSGIGASLCHHVVENFRKAAPANWLLVEAEKRQADFYRRQGFATFACPYDAPQFGDAGSIAMSLQGIAKSKETRSASRAELCDIIEHLFLDGYGLEKNDPRLVAQLAAIADPTPLIGPEVEPT